MNQQLPHVVVVGAGFGGIGTVRALDSAKVRVTFIDKHDHHLFQPLIYQVATCGLMVEDVAYPTRKMVKKLKNVTFRMAEVAKVDAAKKELLLNDGDTVGYDYLVVAAGGMTNHFGMESVAKHTLGMKTLEDSIVARNHILRQFERAAFEADEAKRRAMLTFAVVGGGPTGVETAGGLSELVADNLSKEFPTIDFSEIKILLIEAAPFLLPPMPEELREETADVLRQKHVDVRLNTQVENYDGQCLTLKGGECIPTNTVVWAAGIQAVPFLKTIGAEQDRLNRVVVDEYLLAKGVPDVFVIGDAANFVWEGRPLPMIAPVAMQQAKVVAKNICSRIAGTAMEKYRYKDLGSMAIIGRNDAVVNMGSMKFKGFLGWCMWMFVHLIRLVDFRNKAVVLVKWIWEYFSHERMGRFITR